MGKEWKEKEKLTASQMKNQIIRRKIKVKKTRNILVSIIGMPFRNPGSTYSSKRSSKGTSVPEETDSGVL